MLKGRRFTPAMIVAMIALAVALSGSAMAAGSSPAQIEDGTIRLIDINPNAKDALEGGRGPAGQRGRLAHAGARRGWCHWRSGAVGQTVPRGRLALRGRRAFLEPPHRRCFA